MCIGNTSQTTYGCGCSVPQFGLVAEDVAKVDSDLLARDEDGTPYSVRYEAVNAMSKSQIHF